MESSDADRVVVLGVYRRESCDTTDMSTDEASYGGADDNNAKMDRSSEAESQFGRSPAFKVTEGEEDAGDGSDGGEQSDRAPLKAENAKCTDTRQPFSNPDALRVTSDADHL